MGFAQRQGRQAPAACQTEFCQILLYINAASALQYNFQHLDDSIRQIAFNDVRRLVSENVGNTNNKLHDRRQTLMFLRTAVAGIHGAYTTGGPMVSFKPIQAKVQMASLGLLCTAHMLGSARF